MKAHINITANMEERHKVLRTLNEWLIREYCRTHHIRMSEDPEIFWATVHKAITAIADLPIMEWMMSAVWLEAHGFSTLCNRWDDAERFCHQQFEKKETADAAAGHMTKRELLTEIAKNGGEADGGDKH